MPRATARLTAIRDRPIDTRPRPLVRRWTVSSVPMTMPPMAQSSLCVFGEPGEADDPCVITGPQHIQGAGETSATTSRVLREEGDPHQSEMRPCGRSSGGGPAPLRVE